MGRAYLLRVDLEAVLGVPEQDRQHGGVRADAGTVIWQGRTASYAALCAWDGRETLVTPVLAAMRALGALIRAELAG